MSLSYRQYLERMNQNPGPLSRSGGLDKSGGLTKNYKITSPPSAFTKKPVIQKQEPIKSDVKMEPENKQDESPLPDKPPLKQKSVLPNKKSPLPDIKILPQKGGLIHTEKGKARRTKVMSKLDDDDDEEEDVDVVELNRDLKLHAQLATEEKKIRENLKELQHLDDNKDANIKAEIEAEIDKKQKQLDDLLNKKSGLESKNNIMTDRIKKKYIEGQITEKTMIRILKNIGFTDKIIKKV